MQKLKVILFKGLPGSGKTTEAKKIIEKGKGQYKRISKDDLREMFDNGHYSSTAEEMILDLRDAMVIYFICKGVNVVIDDTNLSLAHEKRIKNILNIFIHKNKAEIIVKDLTKVSLETCIKRDLLRKNPVGAKIIRKMYKKFIEK